MKKLLTFVVVVPAISLIVLKALAALHGSVSIGAYALSVGPLITVAIVGGTLALTAYFLSILTGDLSWVDRMWSTAPIAYGWVYAWASGYDLRTTVTFVLIAIWGIRLTFNFARRGGFTAIEDYRWAVLRERITNPIAWQAFNLFFISGYQHLLLVLFTLPMYGMYRYRGTGSTPAFWAGTVVFMGFLVLETIADQQQWRYQNAKTAAPDSPERQAHETDVRRGFRTTGLFRFSRHPNYFGEIMIWWTVYFLGTTATGSLVNPTGVGAVLLTVLFIGSTAFTESITSRKYPEYADYKARTSAIVPLPPRRLPDSRLRSTSIEPD